MLLDHKEPPAPVLSLIIQLDLRTGDRRFVCGCVGHPYPDGRAQPGLVVLSTLRSFSYSFCDCFPDVLYLGGLQTQFLRHSNYLLWQWVVAVRLVGRRELGQKSPR
jgi:hypothetical protein